MKPKTDIEIQNIRQSGMILADILRLVSKHAVAGVTTAELGEIASAELKKAGAGAPFLHFGGGRGVPPFPNVICISINDEVVHGIPGTRVLHNGDIVGLDFGVNYNGMITDSAVTIAIGEASKEAKRLIKATQESLQIGIQQVKAGASVGDISSAIEARLRQDKLGIVDELAGHGVGHALHEDPWIPNVGRKGKGPVLKAGMTIAIEPMATLGGKEVQWHRDGWTISTLDGSLAAHFEHTVLVTEDGCEVLTVWK